MGPDTLKQALSRGAVTKAKHEELRRGRDKEKLQRRPLAQKRRDSLGIAHCRPRNDAV